jgi:hypothetical protein
MNLLAHSGPTAVHGTVAMGGFDWFLLAVAAFVVFGLVIRLIALTRPREQDELREASGFTRRDRQGNEVREPNQP